MDFPAVERAAVYEVQAGAALEQFEQLGYVHAPQVISPDTVRLLTDRLYGELDRWAAAFRTAVGARLDEPEAIEDVLSRRGPEWLATQPRDLQHLIRGEFPLEARMHADLLSLTREPMLVALVQMLAGEPALRMHFPPMLRMQRPKARQSCVPLHQDAPYFKHLQSFVTVWVPLCPITDACGGVTVLEGSHRLGALQHRSQELWGECVPDRPELEAFKARHVLMEPGDALLFGPHLLHRSHANTSQRVRCSIDSRWFGASSGSTRQYHDLSTGRLVQMF